MRDTPYLLSAHKYAVRVNLGEPWPLSFRARSLGASSSGFNKPFSPQNCFAHSLDSPLRGARTPAPGTFRRGESDEREGVHPSNARKGKQCASSLFFALEQQVTGSPCSWRAPPHSSEARGASLSCGSMEGQESHFFLQRGACCNCYRDYYKQSY